jgi:hypothetical protein
MGFQWDVEYLTNSVVLKVLGLGTAGDFDGDGDVDGRDFLAWQRNPGVGNLADWQLNYGTGALGAIKSVPEPAAMMLVAGFSLVVVARSRCRKGTVQRL